VLADLALAFVRDVGESEGVRTAWREFHGFPIHQETVAGARQRDAHRRGTGVREGDLSGFRVPGTYRRQVDRGDGKTDLSPKKAGNGEKKEQRDRRFPRGRGSTRFSDGAGHQFPAGAVRMSP